MVDLIKEARRDSLRKSPFTKDGLKVELSGDGGVGTLNEGEEYAEGQ